MLHPLTTYSHPNAVPVPIHLKVTLLPANIYLFKVKYRNTRKKYDMRSKSAIKIQKRCHWHRSCVTVVNFEHISHIFLVFYCWLWTCKFLVSLLVIILITNQMQKHAKSLCMHFNSSHITRLHPLVFVWLLANACSKLKTFVCVVTLTLVTVC